MNRDEKRNTDVSFIIDKQEVNCIMEVKLLADIHVFVFGAILVSEICVYKAFTINNANILNFDIVMMASSQFTLYMPYLYLFVNYNELSILQLVV